MDAARALALANRGLRATSGLTAPQEFLGGLGLLKDAVRGRVKNLRLGSKGEIMYDNSALDTPAAAMGSFVQTSPGSGDADVLKHELRHVSQSDVLGPAYMPAAVAEVMQEYGSGPLERDAIQHATPQSELLREGASMNKGANAPGFQRLLELLQGGK
jgi:hypothetical protein